MFKHVVIGSALVLGLSLATLSNNVMAEDNNSIAIGVVNMPYILNDIPQSKTIREAIEKEFGPRAAELQKIEADGQALSQQLQTLQGDQLVEAQRKLAQMQSDFNLKGRAFQEDQRKRLQEEQSKINVLIQRAVDTIAKERGLQLVFRGETVIFATEAVNISDEVIARVAKMGDPK